MRVMSTDSRTLAISSLLFGSGLCALIYQTTWFREFRLVFGASTAASAAVLGVFMAGIGFGGIILGKRSETKARPLAFYAKLELLIALSAALSPLLIWATRHLYIALGGTFAMGMILGTMVRLVLASLIIGVPTFLMGGTLPAAARAAVAADDVSRRAIGILYGANTLGAVAGAILGTFYLFESFGNHLTLWWAAAINALISAAAFRLSKPMPALDPRKESSDEKSAAVTSPFFVFSAAGVVGFSFFLMEMVWYRMLGPLLGGSTFSFGLILAAALLGIGSGGLMYALFDWKRSASLHLFALTCAAEAFFIALPFALGDRIAVAAMLMRPLGTLGFYGHVVAWSAICFIVVFPAALISGAQFPILMALLGKGRRRVGYQTGVAYAWNTTGALIGSLAGGFGLIPLLSAPGVWKLVVVILSALAIAAACLCLREPRRWLRFPVPLCVSVLAVACLWSMGPTAFWRHGQIGVGRLKHYEDSPNQNRDRINAIRCHILWEAEGRESSVALSKVNSLAFIVNGKSDGNAKLDAGTQIMCGIIGAILHPNPEKALVVGLGTGSTAGWLGAVPSIQQVDTVELEPAILKVAELCEPVNHQALKNPKVNLIIGDGRELLLTARDKYDLVVSEPSNPYRSGVAGLFTREFYKSVDQRLKPGGMFLQWVQSYDVDDRTIEIFYRTLGSVFSNIESWQTEEGDILLAASREPIIYDVDLLRGRLEQEPFRSALLAAWKANGFEDFMSHYIGNNKLAKAMQQLKQWPLNTDDQTVIEFAFARSVSASNGFQLVNLRAAAHDAHCDRPASVRGEIDWAGVEEGRLSSLSGFGATEKNVGQQSRGGAFNSYRTGDLPAALRFWRAQGSEPKTVAEVAMLAECMAAEGDSGAVKYIEQLRPFLPTDAEGIRAMFYWNTGRRPEAVESLKGFLLSCRNDPWPEQSLIERAIKLTETITLTDSSREAAHSFYQILGQPFCVWNGEVPRMLESVALGVVLDGRNAGNYTASSIALFEPNVIWMRSFLELRKACYTTIHSPLAARATRDLDEFMQHEALTNDALELAREIEIKSDARP